MLCLGGRVGRGREEEDQATELFFPHAMLLLWEIEYLQKSDLSHHTVCVG